MSRKFLRTKQTRIMVIGLAIIAVVVAGIVTHGALRAGASGYNRTCPVSGARCSSEKAAAVSGCHG